MANTTKLVLLVAGWYIGNTLYNIYNKKACNNIHAHWSVAFAQLVVSKQSRCTHFLSIISTHACLLKVVHDCHGVIRCLGSWLYIYDEFAYDLGDEGGDTFHVSPNLSILVVDRVMHIDWIWCRWV